MGPISGDACTYLAFNDLLQIADFGEDCSIERGITAKDTRAQNSSSKVVVRLDVDSHGSCLDVEGDMESVAWSKSMDHRQDARSAIREIGCRIARFRAPRNVR